MLNPELLSSRKSYLLALSGGRDSICLLHLLLESGFRKIHLVHLNHQLRGKESEADARFVASLAKKHGLPLTLKKAAITALAKQNGESLETTSRHARHQLFAEVARETNCSRVLLAHHAEDQAETCLFNLLRGSSGVKGMASESEFYVGRKKLTFLRPLLQTRRATINTYLAERRIAYREDHSNRSPDYTRNRIRHEALPLLEEILQRDIVPSLLRAEKTTRDKETITAELLDTLQLLDPRGQLFLPKLRSLSKNLQLACLRQFLTKHKIEQPSQALLENALLLVSPDGPPALNLPGNRFLRRKQARIFLT